MKKSFIYIFKTIFFLNLFLIACTETNTVVTPGEKPVVIGYLSPGSPVNLSVKTEIPYAENEKGTFDFIDGLKIKISDNTGKVYYLKSEGNGNYSSSQNEIVGPAGTIYNIEFEYKNRKVEATTQIPKKPIGYKLDKYEVLRSKLDLSNGGFPTTGFGGDDNAAIVASWENPNKEYHFLAAEASSSNLENVITLPQGAQLPSRRFTQSPSLGTSNNLTPRSFEYFGAYNIILYTVNIEYADLYRSGGTTSQNISTPPSNIKNGLGIFTGINSDTLSLKIKKK